MFITSGEYNVTFSVKKVNICLTTTKDVDVLYKAEKIFTLFFVRPCTTFYFDYIYLHIWITFYGFIYQVFITIYLSECCSRN